MNEDMQTAYEQMKTKEVIKALYAKYEYLNGQMSDDEKMAMVFGYLNGRKERT